MNPSTESVTAVSDAPKIDWAAQPLGEVSDAALGRLLGVSRQAVHDQRTRLGIAPYDKPRRERPVTAGDSTGEVAEPSAASVLLAAWGEHLDETADQLAARLGVDRRTYYRWRAGLLKPPRSRRPAIETATEGRVKVAYWTLPVDAAKVVVDRETEKFPGGFEWLKSVRVTVREDSSGRRRAKA